MKKIKDQSLHGLKKNWLIFRVIIVHRKTSRYIVSYINTVEVNANIYIL